MEVLALQSRLSGTRWQQVIWFDEIDSTNRWLASVADRGEVADGTVAIAGVQTAGRGRLGRTWTAPSGSALLMSVYVVPTLPLDEWPMLPLALGLAICDTANAVRHGRGPAGHGGPAGLGGESGRHGVAGEVGHRTGEPVRLKWPNDVVQADAPGGPRYHKLAGVLAEALPNGVVIGAGTNLFRPTDVPAELDGGAAVPLWLDEIGSPTSLIEFAADVLRRFDTRLHQLSGHRLAFLTDYRSTCLTLGQTVVVERTATDRFTARAVEIDDVGRLIVETDAGRETLHAGDVHHLRPSG